MIRRPGNSIWNDNTWTGIDSFYEFRLFNANIEQIKTIVDTTTGIYDASNNGQTLVWTKLSGAGQSYFQSVGNILFWGDGTVQKKWINTLQQRIPYVSTGTSQNPYNFTPFELDSFIIDSNGDAQQLIATVLQLASFYVLNNTIVFLLKQSYTDIYGDFVKLPLATEILAVGEQVYFGPSSQVAQILGATTGITLTINAVGLGGIQQATVNFGGTGYTVGDTITVVQPGSTGGALTVATTATSGGVNYGNVIGVKTTTSSHGIGCFLTLTTSGGVITSVSVYATGSGYSIGDILFIPNYLPPGPFPHPSGGFVKITSVNGTGGVLAAVIVTGVVTSVNIASSGTGYAFGHGLATTGGTGTGLTVNVSTDNDSFSASVIYGGGPITTATVVDPGSNYFIGDVLTPIETGHSSLNTSGGKLVVSNIQGAVETISLVSGGPAVFPYSPGAVAYTTSGGGTGAAFSVTSTSGGLITGINILSNGNGFNVGDAIYLTQGSATGAVLTVATVVGTSITTVSITRGGLVGYSVASGVSTTTSGLGTGATINITSVSNGQITGATVAADGSGYAIGDFLYPVQSGASGGSFQITALTGTVITGFNQINQSSMYTGYLYGVTLPTTGGHGSGCTVSLSTHVGVPVKIIANIISGGNGYQVGDTIYPTVAGSSGNMFFTVLSVSPAAGPIVAVTITNGGFGYVSENDVSVTGGNGTGATFDLIVANPESLPSQVATDTPTVFNGGNPISDSRPNNHVIWSGVGQNTIDGSALWYNRGATVDGGLIYNWGIASSSSTPSIIVNNAEGGWVADTYYNQWGFIVVDVSSNNYLQKIFASGKAGGSAPPWNTTAGQITTDGTAKWQCLANDGDTSLVWAANTKYSVGHVVENTVSSVSCVFQLQPYSGIRTQGSNFPVYCWQCNSQSGSDVGAAGELPNGSANTPMAQKGGQPTSTATFSGTMDSLFLSTGGSPVTTSSIAGNGTVSGSPTALFSASQNLSIAMLPTLVIPAAGIYTFQIGHQNALFWGIGNGTLTLNVTDVQIQGNVLTITCDTNVSNILSQGVSLTFNNIATATFLDNQTVTVQSATGSTFAAEFTHSNYGPAPDTGQATSGATLAPSMISGPISWPASTTPNTYNFATGTPILGLPIMSANYPSQGTSAVVDTVQVSFPSAGVYPCEIQKGFWYHSISGYSTPTVSPALPGTTFDFFMIYQPPNSTTYYNIIPQGIASSSSGAPTWPAFPATIADMQAIAPAYPSVTEASGNYTWWNLGPSASFAWTASANYTTSTFIIDPNTNKELAYVPGVSGTTEPTFSTTLYGLVADVTPLVWMNDGPVGSSPFGTLSTTQGGWMYVVALVDTLDDTVSNASTPSVSTGNFFGASGVYVSGGLPGVIDPQADYAAIFRTDDGGATYFLIPPPASGNGNTEYTLPLSQYLSSGFTDTTPDANLNTLLQAPLAQENTPPKNGSINPAYQDNRIFVSIGNTVYWSSGPDTPIGNGFNGFSPLNYAEFPSKVTKLVPLNIGMLVMTVSDVYLIAGNGTAGNPFSAQPFIERLGLLSYNALTVNGSIIYMLSTDKQCLELNVHSGVGHVGVQVADVIGLFDPSAAYLTWHVSGSNDECLFVADGSTGWYRMSPTAAPENGALSWSLKANLVNGCGPIQSIETTPGNIVLLSAPAPGTSGPILVRDYTTNTDNGQPYPANFILGSLVLAYPGQVATVEFITTECLKVPGSQPISLGVRIGEIAGNFEDLVFWTNDPPQLVPSSTLYSQRFYLSQTKQSAVLRHMQIFGEFEETNSPDELYTLTVYGGYQAEL